MNQLNTICAVQDQNHSRIQVIRLVVVVGVLVAGFGLRVQRLRPPMVVEFENCLSFDSGSRC